MGHSRRSITPGVVVVKGSYRGQLGTDQVHSWVACLPNFTVSPVGKSASAYIRLCLVPVSSWDTFRSMPQKAKAFLLVFRSSYYS